MEDPLPNFNGFDISHVTYKVVEGVDIQATVYVPPETPKSSPRPVIIRWHGGYYFSGKRDSPYFFSPWIPTLARKHHAILVSADYRLMPEANGRELLSDLASFMHWLPNLTSHLAPSSVAPDLSRTLITGESAGGWCSAETSLLHGTGLHGFPDVSSPVKVRAAISQCGMLDLKTPFYTQAGEKSVMGTGQVPADTLDKHIAEIRAGRAPHVLSNIELPARLDFGLAAVQQGRFVELLGEHESLYPMEVVRAVPTAVPTWIFTGGEDTAVPAEGSLAFADLFRRTHPTVPLKLYIVPGEHGLDASADFTHGWLKEGLSWVEQFWH